MTGALTLEIQQLLKPELDELFEDLGHDLVVVRGGSSTAWNQSSDPGADINVRGLLMPASQRRRAGTPAGLPVPDWVAYLPYTPDLGTPGWHLFHEGRAYYPSGDAEDPGGQGVVWIVPLRSPGEVTSGPSEPGWTG
ncbi:hypothetical protein DEIGR_100837 [Deinococcus grandis]|uniref:Uncharacterized protein n=1 Tax=Deinococcus grandis TaxID=57498 RepID=A0A100HJZ6_9DEIO|nr:hypothetical protein [Deinococcus grandis]BBN95704.1 hypothetical protein DEGR_24370 [Deinococcus grandis]GAQ20810.1 hypothetical protein DEIGR_100837 [Deinococcus grandis]